MLSALLIHWPINVTVNRPISTTKIMAWRVYCVCENRRRGLRGFNKPRLYHETHSWRTNASSRHGFRCCRHHGRMRMKRISMMKMYFNFSIIIYSPVLNAPLYATAQSLI